jgi:hypothetical protein
MYSLFCNDLLSIETESIVSSNSVPTKLECRTGTMLFIGHDY